MKQYALVFLILAVITGIAGFAPIFGDDSMGEISRRLCVLFFIIAAVSFTVYKFFKPDKK